MTTNQKVIAAATLGTIAFNNGLKRIYASDKEVLALLNKDSLSNNKSHKENMKIMKAWYASWDAANLSKPC